MGIRYRLLIVATLALGVGCGGAQSPTDANSATVDPFAPIDELHQGVIAEGDNVLEQDGSLYDVYTFAATAGMKVILLMESNEVDPYLILLDPDGEKVGENDDISSENRNASVEYAVETAGTYSIIANTYEGGQYGSYTLRIRTLY